MVILQPRESLGGQLGRSLGEGLTSLANAKLENIQKRNQAHGLMALGYTPEQATQLSQLPQELLKPIIASNARASSSINKTSSAEALRALVPGLSEEHAQAISNATPAIQAAFYRNVLENPELKFGSENANNIFNQQQFPEESLSTIQRLQNLQQSEQPNILPEAFEQLQNIKKPSEKIPLPGETLAKGIAESKKEKQLKAEEKERRKEEHFEKKAARDLANKQALEAQKNKNRLVLQERKEKADLNKFEREDVVRQRKAEYDQSEDEKKHTEHAFKETKPYREQLDLNEKAAKVALDSLDRMEELNNKGDLATPGYIEGLKRAGLDVPALMGADTEEFNKLAQGFLRGAKDQFGGRVTNYEAEQFLKQIPSLSQSPEGRQRVIANMRRIYKQDVILSELSDKIISDNNDVPPLNLDIQVKKASKNDDPKSSYFKYYKQLRNIGEQFKADIKKEVPKGQNKLITGLQTATGSIIGAPGKILGGIGNALGKVIG